MSLDEKLEQILGKRDHPYFTANMIEQIKQAFIDEGWISPEKVDEIGKRQLDFGHRWGMMTGQEWYDRFKENLYQPPKQMPGFKTDEERSRFYRDGGSNFMYHRALEAAKRAGGLEEKA